jgi:hypothetical protein
MSIFSCPELLTLHLQSNVAVPHHLDAVPAPKLRWKEDTVLASTNAFGLSRAKIKKINIRFVAQAPAK